MPQLFTHSNTRTSKPLAKLCDRQTSDDLDISDENEHVDL